MAVASAAVPPPRVKLMATNHNNRFLLLACRRSILHASGRVVVLASACSMRLRQWAYSQALPYKPGNTKASSVTKANIAASISGDN